MHLLGVQVGQCVVEGAFEVGLTLGVPDAARVGQCDGGDTTVATRRRPLGYVVAVARSPARLTSSAWMPGTAAIAPVESRVSGAPA